MTTLIPCGWCDGTGVVESHATPLPIRYQRRADRKNDATRPTATRHRTTWTSKELELVMDPTKTRDDLARELGRTWQAIKAKRRDLHAEARRAEQEASDV